MATKILKLVSEQTAPFNKSQNKVDIIIPQWVGYSDLSKSCIELDLKVQKANVDLGLTSVGFSKGLDAKCLLKNVHIETDRGGMIESVPAVNVLNANLEQYIYDFEDLKARELYGRAPADMQTSNLVRQFDGDDSPASSQHSNVKIPLSQLFGVGKFAQFPNNLMGNVKIHLEFEDNVNIIKKLFHQTNDGRDTDGATAAGGDPDDTQVERVSIVNLEQEDAVNNFFMLMKDQPHPFYKGAPIGFGGSGGKDATRTVTQIDPPDSDGKVKVTVSGAGINHRTKHQFVSLRASGNDTPSDHELDYVVNEVKLVLYQYMLNPSQTSSLNNKVKKGLNLSFMTYSLERLNIPAIAANASFDRQFDIEPNCINVMTLTPIVNTTPSAASPSPLFSRFDKVKSYRWRLDGVDTTSRDIIPCQSLYHDRLMATLTSGYVKVKNLNLNPSKQPVSNGFPNPTAKSDVNEQQVFVIPSPVPLKQEPQVLQLRINQGGANSTAKTMYVYKQVQKQLKITTQGVQVV